MLALAVCPVTPLAQDDSGAGGLLHRSIDHSLDGMSAAPKV